MLKCNSNSFNQLKVIGIFPDCVIKQQLLLVMTQSRKIIHLSKNNVVNTYKNILIL